MNIAKDIDRNPEIVGHSFIVAGTKKEKISRKDAKTQRLKTKSELNRAESR